MLPLPLLECTARGQPMALLLLLLRRLLLLQHNSEVVVELVVVTTTLVYTTTGCGGLGPTATLEVPTRSVITLVVVDPSKGTPRQLSALGRVRACVSWL